MIKVIIFDLGGVYFKAGTTLALKEFEEILGIPVNRLQDIFGEHGYGRDYRLGKLDEKDFWEIVIKILDLDYEKTKKLSVIWHSSYTLNKGMKSLVRRLRKKCKVAVLSNNTKERVGYLNKKYGLNMEFDAFVYSYEYGYMKPDPRLLNILLCKLGVKKEEVILVDNTLYIVESLRKIGVRTLLFQSSEQIQRELTNILTDSL